MSESNECFQVCEKSVLEYDGIVSHWPDTGKQKH